MNYPTSSDDASELSNIVGWRLRIIQHRRVAPSNYQTSSDGASELSNIVGWRLRIIQHRRMAPPNYPTSSDGAFELSNIVGWRLWLIQPTLIVKNVGRLSGEAAPPDIGETPAIKQRQHQKAPKKRTRSKLP